MPDQDLAHIFCHPARRDEFVDLGLTHRGRACAEAVAGDDGKSGVLCRLQQTVAELVDEEPLDGTAVSGRRARHGIP